MQLVESVNIACTEKRLFLLIRKSVSCHKLVESISSSDSSVHVLFLPHKDETSSRPAQRKNKHTPFSLIFILTKFLFLEEIMVLSCYCT